MVPWNVHLASIHTVGHFELKVVKIWKKEETFLYSPPYYGDYTNFVILFAIIVITPLPEWNRSIQFLSIEFLVLKKGHWYGPYVTLPSEKNVVCELSLCSYFTMFYDVQRNLYWVRNRFHIIKENITYTGSYHAPILWEGLFFIFWNNSGE